MAKQINKSRIRLKPKKDKILSAVLHLIQSVPGLSRYDIVKSIFLADRMHLNKHGRPVTFDNYVAMKLGPVPSYTYNMLKGEIDFQKEFGLSNPPWEIKKEGNLRRYFQTTYKPDANVLSESDLEALDTALKIMFSLTVEQIKMLTHIDPAYKEAWARRGDKRSVPIEFENFIEGRSQEEIEEICHVLSMAS